MSKVIFKHSEQSCVYPPLIAAINRLCEDYKKGCLCVAGYRSEDTQRAIAQQILKQNPTNYFKNDRVYDFEGRCIVGAPGSSNHNFCIAMDITDVWFKVLGNVKLAKYGLIKPMSYEPWHVELISTRGISQAQKETIRDSCLKGVGEDMTVEEFQIVHGLKTNGVGPITRAKAKEVMAVCHEILGIPEFKTAEELIKATQSSPDIWLTLLKVVKYFDSFIMNIYKKMRGE